MASGLVLFRLLQFAVAMLLWGWAALQWACPPGAMRAPRWGALAAGVNLAAALGWLAAEAALVGDGPGAALDPHLLLMLLTASHFGHVWLLHLALAAALLGAALTGRGLPVWLAGANLGGLALVGHGVLPGGGLGLLHLALSVLHLLAAGFWLGGLVVILPLLAQDRLTEATAPILRQFSRLGHLAVALVFATGAAKAGLILLTRSGQGPAADYRALLVLKLVAVALMVGLALINRYRFVPRMARGDRAAALAALRRGTLAELALAAAVLGLVSLFATLSPFAAS